MEILKKSALAVKYQNISSKIKNMAKLPSALSISASTPSAKKKVALVFMHKLVDHNFILLHIYFYIIPIYFCASPTFSEIRNTSATIQLMDEMTHRNFF